MFRPQRGYRSALFLIGAAASWGIATVISKRAVAEIGPLTLLAVQLAVSVIALLAFAGVRRTRIAWSPGLRRLGLLGLLNPGLAYALGLLGLVHITASMSVLLWAVEPLLIIALATALGQDRITWPVAGAAVAGLVGVLLVVSRAGGRGNVVGVALTIAGVAACAAYTVICRRLLADDSTMAVVMVQQGCALALAVVLAAGSYVLAPATPGGPVSAPAWLSAIGSGVLYYAVAFWLYLAGCARSARRTRPYSSTWCRSSASARPPCCSASS